MKNSNFICLFRNIIIKSLLVLVFFLFSFSKAQAGDSLTLAQSFINLSLTKTYFDSLSTTRISKILPYIEGEMESITDKNFINDNKTLYNTTYSYLYFLKANLLFKNKSVLDRTELLNWKNTLDKSIQYFNKVNLYSNPDFLHDNDNEFYDFAGFTWESCTSIYKAINNLKSQFIPYFSKDINPGLQRVLLTSKNDFYYDSLKYYSGLYDIPAGYKDDALILRQAFVILTLTRTYFDSLTAERVSKIIQMTERELMQTKDTLPEGENKTLYNAAYSDLYFLKARLLYRNKTEISRDVLLTWKSTLHKSIVYYNNVQIDYYGADRNLNTYYVPVSYNSATFKSLSDSIAQCQNQFNAYFSKDIYPDFQRIFYSARNKSQFSFDSLEYFASIYGMHIGFYILNNSVNSPYTQLKSTKANLSKGNEYNLPLALDLISQYLQLSYITQKGVTVKSVNILFDDYSSFIRSLNPKDNTKFSRISEIPKDDFFRKELNNDVCEKLHKQLKRKFPDKISKDQAAVDIDDDSVKHMRISREKYYFPIPVPFPSCKISINHFHPELKTMLQTANYIEKCFDDAGYLGRLHYFYIREPGFAVTTGIEKIQKNGSPAQNQDRWNLTISNDGSISLYQIFKAIFFATESDYRMISCIIASHEVAVSQKTNSIKEMNNLINHSYSSLPTDLESMELPDKTLTVLVYHFYQSDVGEVPVLDTKQKLTVQQHLINTSTLARLIIK